MITKLQRFLLTLTAIFATFSFTNAVADDYTKLARHMSYRAVNVLTRTVVGSGTIFADENHRYILTCGHVVANNNDGKYSIRVYQNITRKGKFHHQNTTVARVAYYSPRDGGYDLALLETKDETFGGAYSQLYSDEIAPDVGCEVFHLGNLKSIFPSSFMNGHISFLDRDIGGSRIRDQFTMISYGGSSGAGVFNRSGEVIGVLSDKNDCGVSFMIPARAVRAWLKEIKVSLD